MSAYEIADLRAGVSDRSLAIMRLWLTVTFGVFVVAYSAGSSLDTISSTALLTFYAISIALMFSCFRLYTGQSQALIEDANALLLQGDENPQVIQYSVMKTAIIPQRAAMALLLVSFPAFAGYLYVVST